MRYDILGRREAPVLLMFPGSFGSARSMQGYTDLLKEKYYVIAVTLDGCDGSGSAYTSKDEVTDKVLEKVKELGISRIRLLYGLSMGGANALNFLYKCGRAGITVENILLDGPAVGKIGKLQAWFFDFMNKQQVKMMRSKTVEEYLASPMIGKITGGRPEVYRVYVEDMLTVCKDLQDVTSDTVTDTCTNQPLEAIPVSMQKRMHIWYGKDAMKSFFYKGLRKAYPAANYRDMSKYGHAMYCIMDPKSYVKDIENIIQHNRSDFLG